MHVVKIRSGTDVFIRLHLPGTEPHLSSFFADGIKNFLSDEKMEGKSLTLLTTETDVTLRWFDTTLESNSYWIMPIP